LASTRAGHAAAAAVRRDIRAGAYDIEWWADAASEAAAVAERYADRGLGLTDGSLVALANRIGTELVATFDERHFRAIRPLTRADAFTLVPFDVS
jgi:predicted nucleic acid-binding protein